MEDLRAVLFDLDGVLLDSFEAWFRTVNAAARHFRKPDIPRERFQSSWGQGLDADLRAFFPGCTMAEVESFYAAHLLDHAGEIRADPSACDVLRALRDEEVLRGVVTNTPTDLARDLLAWAGLIGLVDVTSGAGGRVLAKPAPHTIEHACDVLQIKAHQALIVGDADIDARAAHAAGSPFVGFRHPGSRTVQNLAEIPALVASAGRR